MTKTTRVVPPDMHKGVVLTTAGVCMLVPIPWYLAFPSYTLDFMVFCRTALDYILSGWPALIPVIGMALVAATSQRLQTMFLVAVTGYLSLALSMTLWGTWFAARGWSGYREVDHISRWILDIGRMTAFGVVAALLIHCITRLFIVRTIAQTGTLCWTCAYDLSATPPNHPCPECGTNPATNRPRRHAIIRLVQTLTAPARRLQTLYARNSTPERQKPTP